MSTRRRATRNASNHNSRAEACRDVLGRILPASARETTLLVRVQEGRGDDEGFDVAPRDAVHQGRAARELGELTEERPRSVDDDWRRAMRASRWVIETSPARMRNIPGDTSAVLARYSPVW